MSVSQTTISTHAYHLVWSHELGTLSMKACILSGTLLWTLKRSFGWLLDLISGFPSQSTKLENHFSSFFFFFFFFRSWGLSSGEQESLWMSTHIQFTKHVYSQSIHQPLNVCNQPWWWLHTKTLSDLNAWDNDIQSIHYSPTHLFLFFLRSFSRLRPWLCSGLGSLLRSSLWWRLWWETCPSLELTWDWRDSIEADRLSSDLLRDKWFRGVRFYFIFYMLLK